MVKKRTVIILLALIILILLAGIGVTVWEKYNHPSDIPETDPVIVTVPHTEAPDTAPVIPIESEPESETAVVEPAGETAIETQPETVKELSFTDEEIAALDQFIKDNCPKSQKNFSAAYLDITTGYVYEYNAAKVYDCASVIKAPFIYSVLSTIDEEEKYVEQANAAGEAVDPSKTTYLAEKYSLDNIVAYDASMYKSGSGVIKTMPYGSRFLYTDLIDYALRHSDCVAYQYLRKVYGYQTMRNLAAKLGTNSLNARSNGMSAHDATIYFREIYNFTQTNQKYGSLMLEPLIGASHLDIFSTALPDVNVAHKYGWDTNAYHEVGIVLGDHPYVLALMSTYDGGGAYVNNFFSGLVSQINAVHNAAWAR